MKLKAYHGSDYKINKFSDEFAGAMEADDAEGPGIYFTNSRENSEMWGKFSHEVILNPRRVITNERKATEVNKEELKAFLDMSEEYVVNRSEDEESDKWMAIEDAIQYNKTEDEVWHTLRYEQYGNSPQLFMRAMTKLGIDAMVIHKNDFDFNDVNEVYHYIVYNPNIVDVVNINSVSINEIKIRKYIRKIISEFATVQADLLPDLEIDPEWRVPQVGSKNFDYDIRDGRFIFKNPHNPNELYDFVINQDGKLSIGVGHYKMAKKSDMIKAAGSLKIDENGKVYYIDNTSGHYRPDKRNLQAVFNVLTNMGVLSQNVKVNYKY